MASEIQIAVAKADLWLCTVGRALIDTVIATAAGLLVAWIIARRMR